MIIEAARAARDDAARARLVSLQLRLAVHESNRLAHARRARATAAATASKRKRRSLTAASPWSTLEWGREDDQLGRVLVPVD